MNMTIRRKADRTKCFEDIDSGTIFISSSYGSEQVFMKMERVNIDDDISLNAVRLEDGECTYFAGFEYVFLPNYDFVIEGFT